MRRIALAIVLLILVAALVIAVWPPDSNVDAITAGDVLTMEVHLQNLPDEGLDLEFVPATSDHGNLLATVQGGLVDHPMKWRPLGRMTFLVSDTPRTYPIEVDLFSTGYGPAACRVGGRNYRCSSDAEMVRVISDCAAQGSVLPK
jgi:hypothetical protein